jgi:hypothetical protein
LQSFVGLKASIDTAAFLGGQGIFEVEAHDIDIVINYNSHSWPGNIGRPVIDWKQTIEADGHPELGYQIGTGKTNADGSPRFISLDMDGQFRIAISVGSIQIQISEFVQIMGSVAFEIGPAGTWWT